jgi:uncharacterized surface protein with fasciclin (FAS1) repeats
MKSEFRADVFSNSYNLSRVVKYHVVLGHYSAEDLLDMLFLKTMEGQRLAIRSSAVREVSNEQWENAAYAHNYVVKDTVTTTLLQSIKVNGAHITRANGRTGNGILHIIDKVLIPHFMTV